MNFFGSKTIHIVYGKDRRAITDTPQFIVELLGLFSYVWSVEVLGLFFCIINLPYLIELVSYPAAIAIWAVIARKRYRKVAQIHAAMDRESAKSLAEQETALSDEADPTQPVLAKYLVCPDCGRRQLSSRTDCWNCKRIFEAEDYEYIKPKPVRKEPEVPKKPKKKYLVCPDCGRTQLSSRTDCWNCKRVFEEQDYEYE
jgi:uncharacterized OB-fold protein